MRVDFHLIDHWLDTAERSNVDHTVNIEIGNANGSDFALVIQFLQCTICTVGIAKRLVQQTQIKIIYLQFPHRLQNRFFCIFVAVMLDPDLGGQENFLSWNTAFSNGTAHFFLVEIALCGVDEPIAYFQCIRHTTFALVLGDLINTVAKLGHFDTIV